MHGSNVCDLTKPDQFSRWNNWFDIITNSGTTEHVEPFESQYECFNIIHDCVKVGGVSIHLVPDIDELNQHKSWLGHSSFYYSKSFFEMLAIECGYEIIANQIINGLRCAALKKAINKPFMGNRTTFLDKIINVIR